MTKHIHKKHNHSAQPAGCSEEVAKSCSCGCGCSCCKKAKALVAGTAALALVLSAWTFISGPRDKAIENWVRENPATILEVLQGAEAPRGGKRQLQAAPADLVKEIINDKTNYSLGNPNGKYVIIEFFDHNCGWCKRTNAAMREALAKPEAKNIRWIPIDTPIFGASSEIIARYVLAAGEQGKYAEMHEAVSSAKELAEASKKMNTKISEYIEKNKLNPRENPADREKITTYQDKLAAEEYAPAFAKIGASLGLDVEKLKATANSEKLAKKLAQNSRYPSRLGAGGGVPLLIVNGYVHPGALFGPDLDEAVEESNYGCFQRFAKWVKSLF